MCSRYTEQKLHATGLGSDFLDIKKYNNLKNKMFYNIPISHPSSGNFKWYAFKAQIS